MMAENHSEHGKSLRNRILHAGSWVIAGDLTSQLIRFGSNLVLTRLLVPDMFGVMAVVSVVLIGLTMFSDLGLLQNVVQSRRGAEQRFLNTAWVVQIARGGLIFLIVLLLSWLLASAGLYGWFPEGSVYTDPILPTVLAVMGVNALMFGFSSTKLLSATREMKLARVSMLEISSQLVGVGVMLTLAWLDPSIWSLVIGALTGSFCKVILSHFSLPGAVNRIDWDSTAFSEIFHFGKWIFLSSILGFLVNQGDRLLLAGLVSSAVLGVYSIAFFLASAMRLLLMKVNSSVFFPALSEVVRDQPEELAQIYYKIRWRVDGITFFIAGFLMVTGQTMIRLLYDERYVEAGWMLEVLSLSLIGVGLLVSGQCLLALGKAKQLMMLNAVQAVVLFVMLPLMFSTNGIIGAVYVVAVAPIVSGIVGCWFMHKLGIFQVGKELMMLPVILIGLVFGMLFNYIIM